MTNAILGIGIILRSARDNAVPVEGAWPGSRDAASVKSFGRQGHPDAIMEVCGHEETPAASHERSPRRDEEGVI
jgi:hypothetical protein